MLPHTVGGKRYTLVTPYNLVLRVFQYKVVFVLCVAAQQTRIGGGQPCGGGKVQLPTSDLQQQFSPFPQLHWSALCCEYSHSTSFHSLTNNLHTLSPPSLLIIKCSTTSSVLCQNRTLFCHSFLNLFVNTGNKICTDQLRLIGCYFDNSSFKQLIYISL